MTIYDRIKELASAKHISIAELERHLGFSNGSLYKWSKTSPSIDKTKMVADYFKASVVNGQSVGNVKNFHNDNLK